MFAETATVNYRLSFADKGQQTSVFLFHLQQSIGSLPFPFSFTANKQKLPFSISSIFRLRYSGNMETWKHGDIDMRHGNMKKWRHVHNNIDLKNSIFKGKPRQFSLICLPFAHCANRSLLFVFLLTKKQTKVIRLQTRTNRMCPYMHIFLSWHSDHILIYLFRLNIIISPHLLKNTFCFIGPCSVQDLYSFLSYYLYFLFFSNFLCVCNFPFLLPSVHITSPVPYH